MPSFDLAPYFIALKGKQYLPVAPRVAWLREDHPDAVITTEIVEHNAKEQWVIVKASISIPNGGHATGMALQRPTQIAVDYIANGETSAIGRALATLGYGTLHALELDQGEQVVDAPVARPELAPGLVATTAQRDWYLGRMANLDFDRAKAIDVATDVTDEPVFDRITAVHLRDIVAAAKADRITYGPAPDTGHIAWRIVTTTDKMASRVAEALVTTDNHR